MQRAHGELLLGKSRREPRSEAQLADGFSRNALEPEGRRSSTQILLRGAPVSPLSLIRRLYPAGWRDAFVRPRENCRSLGLSSSPWPFRASPQSLRTNVLPSSLMLSIASVVLSITESIKIFHQEIIEVIVNKHLE